MRFFVAPALLTAVLVFTLGFVFGQSLNLGWQLPMGISLSVFVATLSFFTVIHQNHAVRTHNKLQVKPHLVIDSQFNNTFKDGFQTFRITVKNFGLGPALINQYSLRLGAVEISDSDAVFVEFVKLVNRVTPAKGKAEVQAMYLTENEPIDKGGEKILFQTSFPTEERTFMQGRAMAWKLAQEIEFTIEYKCLYGRTFEVKRKKPNSSNPT